MRRLVIAPIASEDLTQIWRFIARNNIDAADRVIDKIEQAMLRVAEMPGLGHLRADVRDGTLRFWREYSYLIAYRWDEQTLSVARIVSGSRDLRRIFGN